MTITNGYATLAEYKAWITMRGGTIATDTADDAVIESLIEAASRYIDNELVGTRFYADSQDATRYYKAVSSTLVYIDNLSAAPTSVKVDQDNDRTYSVTLATTDYDLRPDNALLGGRPYSYLEIAPNSTQYFPTQVKGVQVVGKFGFPAVPDDINVCCMMITQGAYGVRSGQTGGGKITVTQAGVVIRPEEVPAMAQKILNHYKAWMI